MLYAKISGISLYSKKILGENSSCSSCFFFRKTDGLLNVGKRIIVKKIWNREKTSDLPKVFMKLYTLNDTVTDLKLLKI